MRASRQVKFASAGAGPSGMFVYALRFTGIGRPSAVVKVGQTGAYRRAIGKLGFSQEKVWYGAPESILLAVSRRRLEDEAALLRLARERLGGPFRGYEWFLGTPAETSEFVVCAQTLLADRARSECPCVSLFTHGPPALSLEAAILPSTWTDS